MEDLSYRNTRETAEGIAQLLAGHKGIDALAMDLTGLNTWTDFFVITTVTSSTHLKGMHRHLKEYASEHGLTILRRQRKTASDEEWSLIDFGNIVVHLMTSRARSFYELERLWGDAVICWKDAPVPDQPRE